MLQCTDASVDAIEGLGRIVLELGENMKANKVIANPVTFQGILLAYTRRSSDNNNAFDAIRFALASNMQLDQSSFEQSTKLLLPEVRISKPFSVDTTKEHLRTLSEENKELRENYINLTRSLRIAEMEDSRAPAKFSVKEHTEQPKIKAWRNVMEELVKLIEAKTAPAS